MPPWPSHGPVHLSGRNSFLVTARDLRLEGEGGHDNDYNDHDHDYNDHDHDYGDHDNDYSDHDNDYSDHDRDYSDHDRDRDDHDVMILRTPLIQMLMMI